jgi:pimeloyl-ACP methyl ester carboxylesterase
MASDPPGPTPAEGPDPYGNPDPEWLRVDWRGQIRQVDVGGTRVNYAELGSGQETLLLVHGLAGSWQNWLEQVPQFARTHRVVALDLPGFGHSPMPPWDISIPAYGDLVLDICSALGLERVTIVGNSLGGAVAAHAAVANEARFDRLGLVSAAGISTTEMPRELAILAGRLMVAVGPAVAAMQEGAIRRPGLLRATFGSVFFDPGALRRELLYEQFFHGTGRPGFVPALAALAGYEILDRLEAAKIHTLVVAGRNDRVVPPPDALEYGRLLRNSETVIFDRTGHCAQLERPVRFNRLLGAFLER